MGERTKNLVMGVLLLTLFFGGCISSPNATIGIEERTESETLSGELCETYECKLEKAIQYKSTAFCKDIDDSSKRYGCEEAARSALKEDVYASKEPANCNLLYGGIESCCDALGGHYDGWEDQCTENV
ncbi:hypothetical protein ACFLQ2_02255 [archaeon]